MRLMTSFSQALPCIPRLCRKWKVWGPNSSFHLQNVSVRYSFTQHKVSGMLPQISQVGGGQMKVQKLLWQPATQRDNKCYMVTPIVARTVVVIDNTHTCHLKLYTSTSQLLHMCVGLVKHGDMLPIQP